MEDALVHILQEDVVSGQEVLILVLMEDALVHQKLTLMSWHNQS